MTTQHLHVETLGAGRANLEHPVLLGSFNLIYVITDQVIGFVGGQVGQKLGQDTEDKANNMFLMAARVGPSAMGLVAQAKGASDKAKGASAAQASAPPKRKRGATRLPVYHPGNPQYLNVFPTSRAAS